MSIRLRVLNIFQFFLCFFVIQPPLWAAYQTLPSSNLHNCSYFFEPPTGPQRQVDKLDVIRILSLNHENLFNWKVEKRDPSAGLDHEKPAWERRALGKYTESVNPDIIVGTEIDSVKTGDDYQKEDLKDAYKTIGIEGNDERGIDIVLFVKKDLAIDVEFESRKEDEYKTPDSPTTKKLFSRDLPALIVRKAGAPKDSKPLFIVLGTHYKSQRPTREGLSDREIRNMQMTRSVEVVEEYQKRYGENVPIILTGDMNENLDSGPNATSILGRKLQDATQVATNPGHEGQGTHVYFPHPGAPADISRLDGFKLNSAAAKVVKSFKTGGFVGKNGPTDKAPASFRDREANYGSDHKGIILELDVPQMLKNESAK